MSILKTFPLRSTYVFYDKSQYNFSDIENKVLYIEICGICRKQHLEVNVWS